MIQHYLKIAIRNLFAHKGQTLICAIGLSLGILAFSVCTYLTTLVMEVNNQFPEYEQMAKLIPVNKKGGKWYAYPYREVKKLKEAHLPEIRAIAFGQSMGKQVCTFQDGLAKEAVFETNCFRINAGIPEFYSIQPIAGTVKEAFLQPHSLLISETMARKIYGNIQEAIDKTVEMEKEFYTIRGVMKDLPLSNQLTGTKAAELLFCSMEEELLNQSTCVSLLLTPDADLDELNRKIEGLGISFDYKSADPAFGLGNEVYHLKVEGINADSEGIQGFKEKILLQSFGFLILLSGLINFFSLSIGSFYNRTRELSMRKSIGAGNRHLFGQLFTEQLLTILLATFLAFCLSESFLPWCIHMLDGIITTGMYLDSQMLSKEMATIFLKLLVACAVMVGITVWRIHKIPGMRGMRGGNTTGNKHRVRNIMLGVEFFICLLFFGAAGMLYMQNNKMDGSIYSTCPKEEQERTFVAPLTAGQLKGIEQEAIRALTGSPLVTEYLVTENRSLGDSEITDNVTFDKMQYLVYVLKVSGNYPEFVHIPLLQGKMPETTEQVLITKHLSNALDKGKSSGRLSLEDKTYSVSGVVDDIRLTLKNSDGFFAIMPVEHPKYCYLRCQSGNEEKLLKHIDQVMRKWIPETLPVPVITFYESLNQIALLLQLLQQIFLIFALICIFITALGIYAAITLDTEKRQKEVAIRKVNGATFKDIVLLFGKLYIRIFTIAALFGVPLLWLLATSIQDDFTEKYNFNNPLFWFCLLSVTACIILAAICSKLYQIARTNPAETIKAE